MNDYRDTEKTASRIEGVLNKVCPAFVNDGSSTAVWHGCQCKAQNGDSCTCVWHQTSKCIAGQWKELAFLDEERKIRETKSQKWLLEAKTACSKV